MGRVPQDFVEAMRWFDGSYRVSAIPGKTRFSVGPDHGFSRFYQWGEHIFEQEIDDEDWQLLTKHPLDRVMFLDLTENPQAWPVDLSGPEWEDLIRLARQLPKPRTFVGL